MVSYNVTRHINGKPTKAELSSLNNVNQCYKKNMTTKTTRKCAVLMGLLLCAAGMAQADTIVTFSVDLSVQIGNGTFNPAADIAAVRGSFNGFGTFNLTNNPPPNTNIYSGTVDDTTDANGGVLSWKFWTSSASGGWENPASFNNRAARLPSTSGASLVLPTPYYGDSGPPTTNQITFQVNMAQELNKGSFNNGIELDLKGDINGWAGGASIMTNDPSIKTTNSFGLVTSNVYVGTFTLTHSPNSGEDYKFYYNNGADQWDSPLGINQDGGGNRFFINSNSQTLPLVDFSDLPYAPVVTNVVTFQVDMTAQILGNRYDPATEIVGVAGGFTSWQNNPLQLFPSTENPDIYTNSMAIIDGVGATEQYKFIHSLPAGLDWENPGPNTPQIGGNRFFIMPNTNALVLPVQVYSDQGSSDLLLSNTLVTFSVNMANAVGTDSTSWDTNQSVFVNGDWMGWPTWNNQLPQMSNAPGSSIYTFQTNMPAGTPVVLTYKYSINGVDDEAPSGNNHVRFIRTYGTYNFPVDTFGTQLVEQSFGNLSVGVPFGGHIPVTWLGRPGVHLQSRPTLTSGSWTNYPATDAHSSTNLPMAGPSLYLRLVHPAQ